MRIKSDNYSLPGGRKPAERIVECPTCEGSGIVDYCAGCDETLEQCTCSSNRKIEGTCSECDGYGEIIIEDPFPDDK
jgi:DnaJ-class molecular chaperone